VVPTIPSHSLLEGARDYLNEILLSSEEGFKYFQCFAKVSLGMGYY